MTGFTSKDPQLGIGDEPCVEPFFFYPHTGQDYTRRLGARYGRDIQARLDDTYRPKLEQRLLKSIQEIERARKAESEAGAQTGQIKTMPGGGVIQPQSAINSQSDRSSSTGQNIRYFFGNLAASARLGYFRECGSLGSGGVQPSRTLPCLTNHRNRLSRLLSIRSH